MSDYLNGWDGDWSTAWGGADALYWDTAGLMWGAEANTDLEFQILIDWTGTGDFSGTYDDVSDYVVGTVTSENGMPAFTGMFEEGTLAFTLRNTDRRFSPENASSPLKDYLHKRVRVQWRVGGRPLWTGFLWNIQPTTGLYGDHNAYFECYTLKRMLEFSKVDMPLLVDITADQAILRFFEQPFLLPPGDYSAYAAFDGDTDFDSTKRYFDPALFCDFEYGELPMPTIGDNYYTARGNLNVYQMIADMVRWEYGAFWVTAGGTPTFRKRSSWLSGGTSRYDFNNRWREGSPQYITGDEVLANRVEITVYPRDKRSTEYALWELTEPIVFKPDETRKWSVPARDSFGHYVSPRDVKTPSGDDFSWSYGGGSVQVYTSGQVVFIEVTANATGGTLDVLRIRGSSTKATEPVRVVATDESIDEVVLVSQEMDLKAGWDVSEAQTLADLILRRNQDAKHRIQSITWSESLSNLFLSPNVDAKIGDLITVTDDQTGHDRQYRITRISHTYTQADMTTRFEIEPIPGAGVLDLSGIPSITDVPSLTIGENTLGLLRFLAEDDTDDDFRVGVTLEPPRPWIEYEISDHPISGKRIDFTTNPGSGTAGQFTRVTIRLEDGKNPSVYETFTITVTV